MLSIMHNPNSTAHYMDLARGGSFFSGSQISNLSTFQQKNTDITIMTAEGDKVTLSANSQREASYLTYSSLVRRGSEMTQIQGKGYSMEVNQDFSITIEGDLSEEELQDIQKSIKTIDKIMQAALSGNTDRALVMTQSVSDMESISGFSANMEIETVLSFAQQTTIETQAAIPESPVGIETGLNSLSHDPFDNSAEKMMDFKKHRGFRNKKLFKPLKKYFSKVFEGISEKYEGSEKSKKLGLAHHIRSEILERIEKEAQGEINHNTVSESEPAVEEPTKTVKAVHTASVVNKTEVEINSAVAEVDPVVAEINPVDAEMNSVDAEMNSEDAEMNSEDAEINEDQDSIDA